jgi:hypothetical protein
VPIPLQLTFIGMTPMPSVGLLIAERSTLLEHFADRIVRCHVIVGVEHRRDCKARRYSVDLDVSTSLGSIAVTQEPGASPRGLDEIIRAAFDVASRELQADADSTAIAAPRNGAGLSRSPRCALAVAKVAAGG